MRTARGSILILVLFVMAVMSLTALSFAYRAGLEHRLGRHEAVFLKLKSHAESAVAIALARLAENTNDFDHLAEPWHTHEPLGVEGWLEDWSADGAGNPNDFVTIYSVIDEEGKLHVQRASSLALEKIGMNSEQIHSLFDWMDSDDSPQAEGAESGFYQGLAYPYRAKNRPLETLEELLMIRGFTKADYDGEDANHNRQIDPEEDDGPLSWPPDDGDGRLRLGWVDLLTTVGDGKININTAPRQALLTLPISEEAVDQIIGYREFGPTASGKLEDHAFRSNEDIEVLQGLTDTERQVLKAVVTFRSKHFRVFVRSLDRRSGLHYALDVLVRMTDQGPQVVQWLRN